MTLANSNIRQAAAHSIKLLESIVYPTVPIPLIEWRCEWRKQQTLIRQNALSNKTEYVSASHRSWKMNHVPDHAGEEVELTSKDYVWIHASKSITAPRNSRSVFKAQESIARNIDPGDNLIVSIKTLQGARGGTLKEAKLVGYLRVATIISCKEEVYPGHPTEKGWYKINVEWSDHRPVIPPHHDLRKHLRGFSMIEVFPEPQFLRAE